MLFLADAKRFAQASERNLSLAFFEVDKKAALSVSDISVAWSRWLLLSYTQNKYCM
jgi:hypothetical protein